MADVKQAFGTANQAITITLDSLASSATAGRESTVIDNTVNKFRDALVTVKIKMPASGTPADSKAVYVYAYGTADGGSTYTDGATGSDAAITHGDPPNLRLIGIVFCPANTNTYIGGPFSVAQAFGGILPAKWGIVVAGEVAGGGSPVTVSPAAVTLVTASALGGVVRGSVTRAPSATSAVMGTVAPTVIRGAITVTPSAATMVTGSASPTVQRGAVSTTPAAVSVVVSGAATAVKGAMTVTPAAAGITLATSVTVTAGGNVTRTGTASMVVEGAAPAVVKGSITVGPVAASAVMDTSIGPVQRGSLQVGPDAVAVILVAVEPTVSLAGNATISPAAASVIMATTFGAASIGGEAVIVTGTLTEDAVVAAVTDYDLVAQLTEDVITVTVSG